MRVTPGVSALERESVFFFDQRGGGAQVFFFGYECRVLEIHAGWGSGDVAGGDAGGGGDDHGGRFCVFVCICSCGRIGGMCGAGREGIGREEAFRMAASCMVGFTRLIASRESPREVREKVATPGGEWGGRCTE